MSLANKPRCEDECTATLCNDIRGGRGVTCIKIDDDIQCHDYHTCKQGHEKKVRGKKSKLTVKNYVAPAEAVVKLERAHCKVPGPNVGVNIEADEICLDGDDVYIDFEQNCQDVKFKVIGNCNPHVEVGKCHVEVHRKPPVVHKKCTRFWVKNECGEWVQVEVDRHGRGSSQPKGKQTAQKKSSKRQ